MNDSQTVIPQKEKSLPQIEHKTYQLSPDHGVVCVVCDS